MVYYASLDGRENHPLFHAETNAVFADGVLLFASGDSLMTRAFDVGTLEVGKEPVLLARGVINDPVTWHADVSATDAGILVYGRTGPGPRQLIWLDQRTYSQTEIAVDGLSKLFLARLSPQGDRVVLQKDREGRDISVFDLREKATRSSLPKLHSNGFPIWSPDGKAIAYSSFRDGRYQIYRTSADGNGDEKELLSDEQRIIPDDWKGNTLIYFRGGLGNQFECWSFALDTKRKRKVFDNIDGCQLSPDGKWIAYAAHEYQPGTTSPGPLNVYVTKFAGGQGKYQVSENSGLGPRWSQDGTELYFLEQTTLSLVRVSVKFSANVPRFRVLSRSSANTLAEPVYAVSPDKERILIERIPEPTVVVVTSFVDTVKQRLRD